jgi:simple sugar transport system substrate-binding protein
MPAFFLLLALSCMQAFGLGSKEAPGQGAPALTPQRSIAVFIPGAMSGSPIYEMLAQGVKQAVAEKNGAQATLTVTVIEGGFNQAEWEGRITALAASGTYDLIVSSNPSLPAIAASVSSKFPKQRFLLLDGALEGNPQIYTLRYNQREQAYMAGHIAALVAGEGATEARAAVRIGLVAGQEYPAMNEVILPAYREGARQVDPQATVDFRVLGNWFDAGKGAELAADMIRGGAKVILTIAGSANEGVVQAAAEAGAKVVWFDINGYGIRPGTVVGSSVVYQDKAAYEQTLRFLEGTLPFGKAELLGVAEGYVDFIEADPDYRASVSAPIREKQRVLIEQIRSGALRLEE